MGPFSACCGLADALCCCRSSCTWVANSLVLLPCHQATSFPCSYSHAHRAPWVTLGHLLLQSISKWHQVPLFSHGGHPCLHRGGGRWSVPPASPPGPKGWFLSSFQPWYWLTEGDPPRTNHFQMAWVTPSWSRLIKGGLSVMPCTTLTTAHSLNI